MRTLTIEFGDRPCGFDVVDEYGRRCNGLAFDEMLGQVISIVHPKINSPQYAMKTEDQWTAEAEARASTNNKGTQ